MLGNLGGWPSLASLISKSNTLKENRVADALNRSMKTIHLAVVSTCETDVKERIRNAQEIDPFVQTVTMYLHQ